MESQKLENLLNLALDATESERERSLELNVGYNPIDQVWELIIKYSGSLDAVRLISERVTELLNEYAIIDIRQSRIPELACIVEVEYVEKPKRLFFQVRNGKRVSCINQVQGTRFSLLGQGVLVAVIDSGIDYMLPDFRNEDGTTRIRYLWDQSLKAVEGEHAPTGYELGVEYTKSELDYVLLRNDDTGSAGITDNQKRTELSLENIEQQENEVRQENEVQQKNVESQENVTTQNNLTIRTRDFLGHGTAVAAIAAGNGRGSGGVYAGVAPQSELIVVKLGNPMSRGFPRTTELMQGIDYAIRKALELRMPVAVNISFGNTYGARDGTSLLERFIDDISNIWKSCICIGSGNEGATAGHTSGRLQGGRDIFQSTMETHSVEDMGKSIIKHVNENIKENERVIGSSERIRYVDGNVEENERIIGSTAENSKEDGEQEIELAVQENQPTLNVQVWKKYVDQIDISLISPSGTLVGPIQEILGSQRFSVDATEVLLYYGEPSPFSTNQEIYLDFLPRGSYINGGVWRIVLTPRKIVDGRYELWLPSEGTLNPGTGFLRPVSTTTLTNPATAIRAITVGAYDSLTFSYADFSGRGPLTGESAGAVKPDIVAPGVNVSTVSVGGGIMEFSGTSFATPFVTGSAALLMEWGIVRGNDNYLYGEKVKAYLRRGAKSLPGFEGYPNEVVGYGRLCMEDSIP